MREENKKKAKELIETFEKALECIFEEFEYNQDNLKVAIELLERTTSNIKTQKGMIELQNDVEDFLSEHKKGGE